MRRFGLIFVLAIVAFKTMIPSAQASESAPVINLEISRSVPAVNYKVDTSTTVPMQGTALIPRADGKAKVTTAPGNTQIEVSLGQMPPPMRFGPSLTYVLWAITPEGRVSNLGELQLDGTKGTVVATTRLNSFALIVTAEPYYAVPYPSEEVVVENVPGSGVKGTVQMVTASQEIFKRGRYAGLQPQTVNPDAKVPMDIYQARAAMAVARMAGAEQYAAQAWEKAQGLLQSAEADSANRKWSIRKQATGFARQAVQAAEDARSIAVKRADEARLEAERKAAADREAEAAATAKASVEAANAQRAAAEKNAEEAALRGAAARQQTELAQQQAAAAAKATAQADAARAAAFAAEQKANAAAAAALNSKEQLRAQLLARFNEVLPTEDSPRGLVVNLGGVNFASGKADLTVDAQVKLARFSGLIAPYPDLKIDVEGYTDNTGAPAFNMKLSQDRASAVRDYLIQQGVKPDSISAKGLGDADPVAPNTTSEGRAQNRRIEIVVSGEVIGTKLGQ